MATHWVVIADAAKAQVFSSDLMLQDLLPIEGRIHAASRLKVRDLVAGARGTTREGPNGAHSAFERHTDPRRAAHETFAREIAGLLMTGRVARRFDRVVLVAPPAFLGMVREHLDEPTSRCIVATIGHDWTGMERTELTRRVRLAVVGSAGMHTY